MKINKLPFDTTIKCECGCEFEFSIEDIQLYGEDYEFPISHWNKWERENLERVVVCPFCRKIHKIKGA